MWIKVVNDGMSNDYETKSKKIGTLYIVIGLFTAFYALFSILSTSAVLGTVLTITGLISTYLTAKTNPSTVASWTKSLLILLCGLLFLFIDIKTLPTIALIIGLFFLLGALNHIYLAYQTRKDATAYAWSIKALFSLIFAVIILSSTTTIPADAIGMMVSLSLITDGMVIIFAGRHIFIRP